MNNQVIGFLNRLIANTTVLYIKSRNAHWNIKGIDFKCFHDFFQTLYTGFEGDIDEIAERLRKLDSIVIANMQFFLDNATIDSYEPNAFDSQTLVNYLLTPLENINIELRTQIDLMQKTEMLDFGTVNFLTSLLEKNEKSIWFLKSHLN